MYEGSLSRHHILILVVKFGLLGMLWGCAQRTNTEESFNLPNRSLTTEPEIRVRLFDLAEFNCDVGAPSTITRFGGKPYAGVLTLFCTQKGNQTSWKLQRGKIVLGEQRCDVLEITSSEPMAVNGQVFPTKSLSMRIEGDRLEVVGTFPLETYLPGVLQRELYQSWHPNTYRALAVAARSFSLVKMKDRRGKFWHVRASPSDQAFVGGDFRPVALKAVASTKGQVLTWKKQVLCTYYSSCCGGRPARASDTFAAASNAIAPLSGQGRPCPCQKSSKYRWTTRVSGKLLGNQFGLQPIRSIKPIQTNPWGRAIQLQLRDTQGATTEVTPEAFRSHITAVGGKAFSGWILKSQYQNGVLTLEGAGFGHGVGLCQFGAEARARSGENWQKILGISYPGAKISSNWGP